MSNEFTLHKIRISELFKRFGQIVDNREAVLKLTEVDPDAKKYIRLAREVKHLAATAGIDLLADNWNCPPDLHPLIDGQVEENQEKIRVTEVIPSIDWGVQPIIREEKP